MPDKVHVKYVAENGEWVDGVPARDLTQVEWDRIPETAQVKAVEAGTHKVGSYKAPKED